MSSRRLSVGSVTGDALASETIRTVEVPSVVNLWASGATAADELGLALDKTEILANGDINIEVGADVIDAGRDQLVFNSVVGAGSLRVPVPVVTAEVQFLISVEPIL